MTAYLVNGKWVTQRPAGQLPTDLRNQPRKTEKRKGKVVPPLKSCQAAHSDGECIHKKCPQTRDGEPMKSGRTCPLPWGDDE